MGSFQRALPWLVAILFVPSSALAYRPFDGTDADVAELGKFELEMGPAHFYVQGGRHYVIAPATVLNLGFLPQTELVVDLKDFVALDRGADPRIALLDTDVFFKHLFREGTLQGKTGLSIAAEGGPLIPEINGTNAFGASLDVILSYRWEFGTAHFNEQAQYTRQHDADLFSSVILEGPYDWRVRPVAELFYEHDFAGGGVSTESALVGAIWSASDEFAMDLGLRGARIGEESAGEVRLGFTWAVALWSP